MSQNSEDLKVALVTGALGHLGKVICRSLSKNKYTVIATDMLPMKPENEKFIKALGNGSVYIHSDLASDKDRIKLIREAENTFSKLDLLINNAAYTSSSNLTEWNVPFSKQSTQSWRDSLEVNLIAPFHLTQLCQNFLEKSERASVINIGSIYGVAAPKNSIYDGTNMNNIAAYAAGKAGLHQLTKWLAVTLAPNIKVNAISLGGIERDNQEQSFIENYRKMTPLNRMAREEDIIGALNLFTGNDADYITGQNILIDGGWSL